MKVDILQGDCIKVMRTLHDESIDCCVTSPPYWGLRDYGVDGQLGLESTPEEYVAKMVEVFREVKRVLKSDGTCWVNLGDCYAHSGACGGGSPVDNRKPEYGRKGYSSDAYGGRPNATDAQKKVSMIPNGLKPKDLVGIPWRVAFALQADGWWLRQDIIWHKPNPMPESVTDRCTKAHEYVFLLAKSSRYWYDSDAVKEDITESSIIRNQSGWNGNEERGWVNGKQNHLSKYFGSDSARTATRRNLRSVWSIPVYPYSEAHFATFPPDLVKPCILAGCRPDGTVLDPFGGSGTTGMVAHDLGRNAILIELNPEYIKIANRRIWESPRYADEIPGYKQEKLFQDAETKAVR